MGIWDDNLRLHEQLEPRRTVHLAGEGDGWAVRGSLWLYRRCLLAYPPSFRRAFAVELTQVFQVCCRDALRNGGGGALIYLWLLTVADLVVSALAERLTGGNTMASTRISRFGGLVGFVGGILWLGTLGLGLALAALYTFAQTGSGMTATVLLFVPLYGAWLLFLVGLVGLTMRLTRASGVGWLRWGAALAGVVACAGALLLLAGNLETSYVWAMNSRYIVHQLSNDHTDATFSYAFYVAAFVGYPVLGVGLALLGVVAARTRALGRLSILPSLMGGVAVVMYFFSDMGAPSLLRNTGPGLLVMAAAELAFILFWAISWLLLGVALARAHPVAASHSTGQALGADGQGVAGIGAAVS